MSGKRTPGLRRRGKQGTWSIQKTLRLKGKSIRLCETTGTRSLEEAERYLARTIEELRSIHVYGEITPLTLAEAGEKYLLECPDKSYKRAETALVSLCAHFGHLQVSELHDGNVQPYARERMRHVTAGTVNRELAILVRILNLCVLHLCARRWRNEAGQPYLATVPAIMRAKGRARAPYPISKDEEERLLAECPRHLRQLVLFALHTELVRSLLSSGNGKCTFRNSESASSFCLDPPRKTGRSESSYSTLWRGGFWTSGAVNMTSSCSATMVDLCRGYRIPAGKKRKQEPSCQFGSMILDTRLVIGFGQWVLHSKTAKHYWAIRVTRSRHTTQQLGTLLKWVEKVWLAPS